MDIMIRLIKSILNGIAKLFSKTDPYMDISELSEAKLKERDVYVYEFELFYKLSHNEARIRADELMIYLYGVYWKFDRSLSAAEEHRKLMEQVDKLERLRTSYDHLYLRIKNNYDY